MSKMVIRYLRLHCQHPAARPEPRKDGVLAVAGCTRRQVSPGCFWPTWARGGAAAAPA